MDPDKKRSPNESDPTNYGCLHDDEYDEEWEQWMAWALFLGGVVPYSQAAASIDDGLLDRILNLYKGTQHILEELQNLRQGEAGKYFREGFCSECFEYNKEGVQIVGFRFDLPPEGKSPGAVYSWFERVDKINFKYRPFSACRWQFGDSELIDAALGKLPKALDERMRKNDLNASSCPPLVM